MDDKNLKETTAINLRSIAQSVKNGIAFEHLHSDYKSFIGEDIRFRELGFRSLEDYIRNIPDVIKLSKVDGRLRVFAVANADTAHIDKLVNRQKDIRARKPTRRPIFSRRGGRVGYLGKNFNPNYKFQPSYTNSSSSSAKYHSRPKSPVQVTSKPVKRPESPAQYSRPLYKPTSFTAPRFERQRQMQSRNQPLLPTPDYSQDVEPDPGESFHSIPAPVRPSSNYNHLVEQIPYVDDLSSNRKVQIQQPRPLAQSGSRRDDLKQLSSASTAAEYVAAYCKMNNLPKPDYITNTIGQKGKKAYIAKLRLGSKSYQTYPKNAETPEAAEELVASIAVEDIKKSEDNLASYPETPISVVEEVQILLHRIEEIVCEKPSGMYTNGIIKEYEEIYKELLPPNWLELLKDCPSIEIEEVGIPYGKVPEGVKYIVRPSKAWSSGHTTPSSTSSKTDLCTEDFSKSIPKNKTSDLHMPKELEIPAGNEWAVYITNVSEVIAGRLIDNDEIYLDLLNAMANYYASHCIPANKVCEGKLYAMASDSDSEYQRVVLLKILDDDKVEVFCPDEGSYSTVPKSNLQELDKRFYDLPYQAVYMILDACDDFDPFIKQTDLQQLNKQSLIAKIQRGNTPNEGYFPNITGIHSTIYSVILYNTNQDDNEDVNLNDFLKNSALNSLSWKLPKLNASANGYLTHVTDNGEIFLRFLHPDGSPLEDILEKYSPLFDEFCMKTDYINLKDAVFVARYDNEKWYRAVLCEDSALVDPQKINVFFIDYGNTSTVAISDICEVHQHSEFLATVNWQAIKCELHDVLKLSNSVWIERGASELVKLAPFGECLMIRVMKEEDGDSNQLAQVNLHRRIYNNDESFIVSINENLNDAFRKLSLDQAAQPFAVPSSLNLKSTHYLRNGTSNLASQENNLKSPFGVTSPPIDTIDWIATPDNIKSPETYDDQTPCSLGLPEIPEEGEVFDVFVTIAANPGNFVIQPLHSSKEMDVLMNKMKSFYSLEENHIEIPVNLLKENEYYAALHTDNLWYRVRLETVLPNASLSTVQEAAVYYVDFGDFRQINVQNLQSLFKEFRVLPCQAIKASLSGVKPVAVDWSADHCVSFKNLIMERQFASLIQKKTLIEEKDFSHYLLELTLIDTSLPNVDTYVHEHLINNGMATAV